MDIGVIVSIVVGAGAFFGWLITMAMKASAASKANALQLANTDHSVALLKKDVEHVNERTSVFETRLTSMESKLNEINNNGIKTSTLLESIDKRLDRLQTVSV